MRARAKPAASRRCAVVARALDSDRMVLCVDRWVDVVNVAVVVLVTGLVAGDPRAAAVIGGFLLLCSGVAAVGAPFAGHAGRIAPDARARFGTALGSTLEGVRTVKLAAATGAVRRHLATVDGQRAAVTEAPIARRWLVAVAPFAGRADLTRLPAGVGLVAGDPRATAAAVAGEGHHGARRRHGRRRGRRPRHRRRGTAGSACPAVRCSAWRWPGRWPPAPN